MIKKFQFIAITLLSIATIAAHAAEPKPLSCPEAAPTSSPTFCSTFAVSATCNCLANGQSPKVCKDLNQVYQLMISVFGSIQRACQFQQTTSTQICIDDWTCFHSGGKDSQGKLCNATGKPC